jgi:hypothetical protein
VTAKGNVATGFRGFDAYPGSEPLAMLVNEGHEHDGYLESLRGQPCDAIEGHRRFAVQQPKAMQSRYALSVVAGYAGNLHG